MFKEGDRVRIELFELNLQHGAGEEYPHLGTGTVGVPVQKKDGKLELDPKEAIRLREQRIVPVILDVPFLRRRNREVVSPWRDVVVKKEEVTELLVPNWLLKSIKEQNPVPRSFSDFLFSVFQKS